MDERIERVVKHPVTVPAVAGVVAFGMGYAFGYFVWGRPKATIHELPQQLEFNFGKKELEAVHEADIQAGRDRHPSTVIPAEVYEAKTTPALVVNEDLQEDGWFDDEDEEDEDEPSQEPTLITQNVFGHSDDGWDYDAEKVSRRGKDYYIVHRDEFFSDEDESEDFVQSVLTYYVGDDIMVDESDVPVYNYMDLVGEPKFGHGSGDENVVYVRNVKRKGEYEILRHSGTYSEEVLGLEMEMSMDADELKHSRQRRMRNDEE